MLPDSEFMRAMSLQLILVSGLTRNFNTQFPHDQPPAGVSFSVSDLVKTVYNTLLRHTQAHDGSRSQGTDPRLYHRALESRRITDIARSTALLTAKRGWGIRPGRQFDVVRALAAQCPLTSSWISSPVPASTTT